MDAAADRDAYLQSVLIGGREPVTIVVRDHDPEWPARFQAARDRIHDALGTRAVTIEHIGSTAVPGLAAKPIVDILVTVPDVDDESAYAPALEAAGFPQRVREPGHRMFRTPEHDVHIHVYEPDAQAVTDYLDLRDWLRQSAEDRARYAATKRELATRQWADMNDYADAKSDVIAATLGRARAWRSSIGR
ncbi:GrpB family protein [Modestobacter sp. NPDC049651]|uniref:GrpB family protein n=1 Tax=unclassified Modestobacter TaxID=2643866 RepID=UPI0033C894AD